MELRKLKYDKVYHSNQYNLKSIKLDIEIEINDIHCGIYCRFMQESSYLETSCVLFDQVLHKDFQISKEPYLRCKKCLKIGGAA